MSKKQLFETDFVGEVGVDSGNIELGDMGDVQLTLPTRQGDGVYAVEELRIDGEVVGYFINVDACREWAVTEIYDLKEETAA